MKTNIAPRGFIGLGIAIIIGVLAIGAAADAYIAHRHHEAPAHPLTATTTVEASSTVGTSVGSANQPSGTSASGNASATVITQSDSGKTIHMHPGDRFLLQLGSSLDWSGFAVSDERVVSRAKNIAVVEGAQGVYEAKAKGTATLNATGAPICAAGMLCAQFLVNFSITVVVD